MCHKPYFFAPVINLTTGYILSKYILLLVGHTPCANKIKYVTSCHYTWLFLLHLRTVRHKPVEFLLKTR